METYIQNAVIFVRNVKTTLKLQMSKAINAYFLKFCFFARKSTFVDNYINLESKTIRLYFYFKMSLRYF